MTGSDAVFGNFPWIIFIRDFLKSASASVTRHLPTTGSRVQNRYYCPVCNVTVERDDRVRGYEFAKDQYVQFTEAELESLETESSNNIELKEFIPLSKIDPVYFENAYYVGAGEGGEKPYRLLADAHLPRSLSFLNR